MRPSSSSRSWARRDTSRPWRSALAAVRCPSYVQTAGDGHRLRTASRGLLHRADRLGRQYPEPPLPDLPHRLARADRDPRGQGSDRAGRHRGSGGRGGGHHLRRRWHWLSRGHGLPGPVPDQLRVTAVGRLCLRDRARPRRGAGLVVALREAVRLVAAGRAERRLASLDSNPAAHGRMGLRQSPGGRDDPGRLDGGCPLRRSEYPDTGVRAGCSGHESHERRLHSGARRHRLHARHRCLGPGG